MALTFHSDVRLTLLLSTMIACSGAACDHYIWEGAKQRYVAAERGRIVELVAVTIHNTHDPFGPWAETLAEPCETVSKGEHTPVPCWPSNPLRRSQRLLEALFKVCYYGPDYRSTGTLLSAAQYLNRDIGAFHEAWIIGTSPLAVAFLRTRSPTTRLYQPAGARSPVGVEIMTHSGKWVIVQGPARAAHLVRDADVEQEADTVLLFPQEMRLPYGQVPVHGATQPRPPAKVFYLREPKSLRSLMRALIEAGELERQAKEVVEVPVLGPDGRPVM